MRHFPLKAVLLAAAALVAVDTAAWFWACARLRSGLEQQVAIAARDGWTLHYAGFARGGWPFAAELHLTGAAVTGSDATEPPGLAWSAEHVILRLSPLHPTRLGIDAAGPQRLSMQGVAAIPFRARTAVAQIDLTGTAPPLLDLAGVTASLPGGALTLADAQVRLPPNAIGATLTALAAPNLPPLDRLAFEAQWTPFPVAATPAAAARAWRAADGHVDLTQINARAGEASAAGTATLTLDTQLQPVLTGRIGLANGGALIDQLLQAGALSANAALAVHAAYGVLAAPAGAGPVDLPIGLRDGVLTVARFPLLRFPPLAWAGGS